MKTKDFLSMDGVQDFIEDLHQSGNIVDLYRTDSGIYRVSWIENKTYVSHTGDIHDDEVWITEDGRMIHIQDLEPEHARNIIRMMIRNSKEAINAQYNTMGAIAEAINQIMQDGDDSIDDNDNDNETPRVLH